MWNRPPLPVVVRILINFDETKCKQRLKMSSKKLIRGGDYTFQMTEIINFWSCFLLFQKRPTPNFITCVTRWLFLLKCRVPGEKAFVVDIFRSSCIIRRCCGLRRVIAGNTRIQNDVVGSASGLWVNSQLTNNLHQECLENLFLFYQGKECRTLDPDDI